MTGRAILRLSPIVLLVVLAACGGGGSGRTISPSAVVTRIYLVRDGKVAPVRRVVQVDDDVHLLQAVADGPTPAERRAGFTKAPANDPRLAVAEKVFTLTARHPKGTANVDGVGYRRAAFEEQTPIILVENPLPFAHVSSPIHADGTANTFEATFQYELKDAAGKILAKHFVTATSGTGQRGTFAVTIPFTVARETAGTLVVYENSAANGKRIHQSEVPLTLEP